MTRANCKAIFACTSLLKACTEVTAPLGIPSNNVYVLPVPDEVTESTPAHMTFDQLLADGPNQPDLESVKWEKGQGKEQIAYLAATSGTSGLQVRVYKKHETIHLALTFS